MTEYGRRDSFVLTDMSDRRWLSELVLFAFFCNRETWITFSDLDIVNVMLSVSTQEAFIYSRHIDILEPCRHPDAF